MRWPVRGLPRSWRCCAPACPGRSCGAWSKVDPFRLFIPRGFAALGLDPHRLVMARTDSETAALGAAETGLREPGLAAVVVETAGGLRSVHGRRLQLAAESGGGLGFVVPGSGARHGLGGKRLGDDSRAGTGKRAAVAVGAPAGAPGEAA